MNIEKLIKQAFKGKVEVLAELQAGLRCQTYLVKNENKKYIFQLYENDTIYQAKKKYDILKLFDENTIPKVYDCKVTNSYAYLITEYKEGEQIGELFINDKFSLNEVSDQLAKTLTKVHSMKNEHFGWITDTGVLEKKNLIDYIKSEYNRLIPSLENLDDSIKSKIINEIQKAMETIEQKSNLIPCLCWYDINPGNILVDRIKDKYTLTGLIDPGGARYGIEEWDLAFIKMELCRNEEEFKSILKSYQKYCDREIDLELLNALTAIVELDCISIRIKDNIILPIPYDTKFRDEIEEIEKMIIKNVKEKRKLEK